MGVLNQIEVNEKYGNLVVLNFTGYMDIFPVWECLCDCGKKTLVREDTLMESNNQKCVFCQKNGIVFELKDDYVLGKTKNNKEFFIDIDDYEKVKNMKIFITEDGYVAVSNEGRKILLHRLLTNVEDGMVVDHINRIRHDNRKKNLRICTQAENMRNTSLGVNNRSGVKGVRMVDNNKWIAEITFKRKRYFLGGFNKIEDAIKKRRIAEIEFFGEFASFSAEEMDYYEKEMKLYCKLDLNDILNEKIKLLIPSHLIRNADILGVHEFGLYSILCLLYLSSDKKNSLIIDTTELRKFLNITDNRTLKNRISKLYENGLINNKIIEFPRNCQMEIVFNDEVYKCENHLTSISSDIFHWYKDGKINMHSLRLLLFYRSYIGEENRQFCGVDYSVINSKLKFSYTTINSSNEELKNNNLIQIVYRNDDDYEYAEELVVERKNHYYVADFLH